MLDVLRHHRRGGRHCFRFITPLFLFLLLVGRSRGQEEKEEDKGEVPCPAACTCEAVEVRCENSLAMRELPRRLPHNETLRRLLISRVNLTAVPDDAAAAVFANVRHLEVLDLHNNHLDNLGDGAFLPLRNLTTLVLRRNSLRHLSPNTFLGLEGLKERFFVTDSARAYL